MRCQGHINAVLQLLLEGGSGDERVRRKRDHLGPATHCLRGWQLAQYHRPIWPAVKQPSRGKTHWQPLFDRQGTQQWAVAAPSITRAINISGDGRLAVAAFSDGTLRWYR